MEPAGVYYCTVHHGIANEDDDFCDFYGSENSEMCVFFALVYDPEKPIDR